MDDSIKIAIKWPKTGKYTMIFLILGLIFSQLKFEGIFWAKYLIAYKKFVICMLLIVCCEKIMKTVEMFFFTAVTSLFKSTLNGLKKVLLIGDNLKSDYKLKNGDFYTKDMFDSDVKVLTSTTITKSIQELGETIQKQIYYFISNNFEVITLLPMAMYLYHQGTPDFKWATIFSGVAFINTVISYCALFFSGESCRKLLELQREVFNKYAKPKETIA